jgi:hypothetical protein
MLNAAQQAVLQWVADGCPDGVMEGYEHRISAASLRTRGLLRISGHGNTWRAELTTAGRSFLENPPSVEPRKPARATEAGAESTPEAGTSRTQSPVKPKVARALSATDQLVADLLAAGGVLRVPHRRGVGEPDYEHRVISARRFGKVPPGKRLRTDYVRGELEIRLEDSPPGTEIDARPVPVPSRLSRLHPVARQFRDRTEYHEVSRKQLGRCTRIIDGLATEVDRRGYRMSNETKTLEGYRDERWSASRDGHLVVTIRGHDYDLRVWEEKVSLRGDWERERQRRAEHRFDYFYSHTPLKPFDKDATGRLTITLDSGYSREGRPASWADRKSWRLEEKLGELLCELEIRAAEDDYRDALAQRAAEERQRRWELEMKRAKERFHQAQLEKTLRTQMAAWQEARVVRAYLAALEEKHADGADAAEWIAWIREYIDRLDPVQCAPSMPERPEPSPEDLKPFLNGLNPYGPTT